MQGTEQLPEPEATRQLEMRSLIKFGMLAVGTAVALVLAHYADRQPDQPVPAEAH